MKVEISDGTYVSGVDEAVLEAVELVGARPGYADGVRWLMDGGFEPALFSSPVLSVWDGYVRYAGMAFSVSVRYVRAKAQNDRPYWCATTRAGNVYSESVQTAVAQAVKAVWDKAVSDQANRADAQAAESFYRDYVQDNPAFESMPHKCWDYIKEHAQDVMKRSYLEHGNEWEGVERAVRAVLRENGMDGDSW